MPRHTEKGWAVHVQYLERLRRQGRIYRGLRIPNPIPFDWPDNEPENGEESEG